MVQLPDVMAYRFDGQGGAQRLASAQAAAPRDDANSGFIWLHLRRDCDETRTWLAQSDLDQFVVEALVADETRPRATVHGDGVVLNLRGVNLHPDAEPEDMISVRLWIEARRIVGVWIRPLDAVGDLTNALERGQAPRSPGDFIAKLALRLADRAEPTVGKLDDYLDTIEDNILGEDRPSVAPLADTRRTAIQIRRYMIPQRDALTTLEIEDLSWLSQRDRSRIREAADRVTRLGEELDSLRDRAQILHDEIMNKRAEQMNKNMLLLSIIASVFLPLGLITGLLGINVGGIPGNQEPSAFWIVCGLLVGLVALELVILKLLGFFRTSRF